MIDFADQSIRHLQFNRPVASKLQLNSERSDRPHASEDHRNLLTRITETPHGISFRDEGVGRLCSHEAMFPGTSTRDHTIIVSVDTRVTLSITWGCISFEARIDVDSAFGISWIALVAVTSSSRNFREDSGKKIECSLVADQLLLSVHRKRQRVKVKRRHGTRFGKTSCMIGSGAIVSRRWVK